MPKIATQSAIQNRQVLPKREVAYDRPHETHRTDDTTPQSTTTKVQVLV